MDDVRAVIIAARGVTISSNFLSSLLETDAIALHRICFEPHNPHPVCDHLLPFPRAKDCEAREKRSRVFRYALSVF